MLRASASRPRDHLIFSLALGTGLRLGELVGLDVGDVFFPDGAPRGRVRLRREIAKRHRAEDVFLPDVLVPKLRRFWRRKVRSRERLEPDAPLFCSHRWRRLSERRTQVLFRAWQVIAGFERPYPFHALRHTAVTNVYRASRGPGIKSRGPPPTEESTAIRCRHLAWPRSCPTPIGYAGWSGS